MRKVVKKTAKRKSSVEAKPRKADKKSSNRKAGIRIPRRQLDEAFNPTPIVGFAT